MHLRRQGPDSPDWKARKLFGLIDKDSDLQLTSDELSQWAQANGNEAAKFLPAVSVLDDWSAFDDWLLSLGDEGDKDGDWRLGPEEFEKLYVKAMTKSL